MGELKQNCMKLKSLFCISLFTLLLMACGDREERVEGLVNVFLIDAPGDFDQVWVEVLGVEVFPGRNGDPIFLEYQPADKKVPVNTLLGEESLLVGRGLMPMGNIRQMNLLLGDEIYVIRGGQRYNMQYTRPESRKMSFQTDFNIEGGFSYDYYIDMNLAQSIQRVGNDYFFDPQGRAFSNFNLGNLSGTVLPPEARPFVFAYSATDTLSTLTNAQGVFFFRGLQAGNYQIHIQPRTGFVDTLLNAPIRVDTLNTIPQVQLRIAGQ
jgi:hypothetical protein